MSPKTVSISRFRWPPFLPQDGLQYCSSHYSLVTHKADDEAEFNRGRYFIGLVFEEWAAVVINFGSLLFIVGFIDHMPVYWFGTVVNYALGHYLLPKR